ncbi:hypothetical protein GCM10010170_000240 [Dactylosporangium salmoneum]|uniref:Uncharacterized protein n=1 Tax=Dactylosporangium salmoneum TaxID=53361 RepID=A0ABN3FAI7_9ACTN
MTLSASRVATAGAGLLVVLATYVALTVPPAEAASDTILSQNKPATASSAESTGLPAKNAVDGNTGTRWASAWTATAWFPRSPPTAPRTSSSPTASTRMTPRSTWTR